jgi:bis(5'-nucleosyl)-tetraphosphatase (symmetrical)
MRKRVFVGDVQGCAEELEALLEALAYEPSAHDLWLVGDLVNRGPDSARVLRRLIELDANSVLGNHDVHLLRVVEGTRRLRRGDSFTDVLEAKDRDILLAWLRTRPLIQAWDDLLCVHAGLNPRWQDPLQIARRLQAQIECGPIPQHDEDLQFLISARHCTADGDRPHDDVDPGPGFAPWDEFYRGERRVVFGHWAMRGLVIGERVRGLDTGCVWGGRLTAWIAEEDRFVSVASPGYRQPGGA